jgi:TonB family protein
VVNAGFRVAAAVSLVAASLLTACATSRPHRAADDRAAAGDIVPVADQRTARQADAYDPNYVYFEFQVEKRVSAAPGSPAPHYPPVLKAAGTQGQVLAQFVVDTAGLALASSFKVLRSDHAQFTEAVRTALDSLRYLPAELHGHKVKQLVQQPFIFALPK